MLKYLAIDISPLKVSRDYRLLFFGQLISFFGTMMSFVAINWQMFELTNSSAMVGYVALAEFFPMFILAFVGGAIADSLDKRKILQFTEVGQTLTTGILLVNSILPEPQIWDYKQIYSVESSGFLGSSGFKIEVSDNVIIDDDAELKYAIDRAGAMIYDAIQLHLYKKTEEYEKVKQEENKGLLGCFDQPIYADEIASEYGNDWFYKNKPWYVVTTKFGRIKLGWRKRVISIHWENNPHLPFTADELFPDVQDTKGKDFIHAYGYEDARKYIKKLQEVAIDTGL
jgi:hypothetical protein